MAVTKAQQYAKQRYFDKHYERVGFDVKKGKRDYYKEEAAKRGLSLSAFFQKAADEYIENHPVD